MKTQPQYLLMLAFLGGIAAPVAAQTKTDAVDWRVACERLKGYRPSNDNADLFTLERYLFRATPEQRAQVEASFLKLLGDPQVTDDAKRFICQQGAYMKSDEAVKILVDLQADTKFSYSACYGLLQIPNPKVRPVLRNSLSQRSGRSLAEAVQTLGALRDGESVAALANQLKNADRDVARAAVVALGEMASAEAEATLDRFESVAAELKDLVADARLKCAASLGGARAEAICSAYLKSPSQPVRVAAYAALLTIEPSQRNARLIAVIQGNDPVLKSVAYREARRGGGAELTSLLTDSLAALPPVEQRIVLGVLRDRGDSKALPQVLKLAESPDAGVRREALSAMAVLGNASQTRILIQWAAREAGDIQVCAREALTQLKDNSVDDELSRLARNSDLSERREIVAAMVARGSQSAVPTLMKLAEDADAGIRREAIRGLSKLAGISAYEELIRRMLNATMETDRRGYQNALIKVYHRSKEPERCVELLLETMKSAGERPPAVLFEVLIGVGSPKALGVLKEGLTSPDAETRKTVLRSMANWPDAGPVPQLIDLARRCSDTTTKALALRAAVALIARDTTLAPAGKVVRLAEILKLADRVDEKRLVVGSLGKIGCVESLDLALGLIDTPELASESVLAIVELAKKRTPVTPYSGKLKKALKKAAEAKNSPTIQKAVQEQLKAL